MIRDSLTSMDFWNKWISFSLDRIHDDLQLIEEPAANPVFEAQFVFDIGLEHLRVMLRHYSRGDAISEVPQYFPGMLDAWELSNKHALEIGKKYDLERCRDWTFDLNNLNHYILCFWLVGLALALNIPDDQWQRLLRLIGQEGKDELLDRVIAGRQPDRIIGEQLLHKKPYQRLLKAINAPRDEQPALLKQFVEHWYVELNRPGDQQPYWYIYGDPEKHSLEMGSYFGRWCIEAVAAVKALGLDDSLCLGHEHYPGDLLRPEGPTTHPYREEVEKPNRKSWIKRLFRG